MVPFVGRQPELAALHALLSAARTGLPQIVLIQGPAGIGKTALIEHFLDEMQVAAAPSTTPAVIRASGEETEELLTYGVLEQLVRSAGPQPEAAAGPHGKPMSDLFAGELGSTSGALPVEDPVTVGTRFLEFLDRLPGAGLILIVDDAQWADRASLHALIFALRRLAADQILTVFAVRDEGITDLPESLGRLINGHRGTAIGLHGLEENDLRDLAAGLGIDGVDAAAARRLRFGTQGNPLHARALLEEFPPADWGPDDKLLPPPRSFRRLVRDRYDSCTADTRALIDAAAVLGQHCPLPTAVALAGTANPLIAVDEAMQVDLLQAAESSSPWALSFPHPLVRAAVYDALGPARRHDLHLAAATLVSDESARLRHRVAAAAEPDATLADDLIRFADKQSKRHEWQSAAAHLVSASRLSPDPRKAQEHVLRAVLWTILRGDAATAAGFLGEIESYPDGPLRSVVLGSLAMAADDPATAELMLAAAWDACGPDEDPEVVATVALITAIHRYGRLDAAGTVEWSERTLATMPPETSSYSVALTYLVHGLGFAGRTAESVAVAASAERQPGDASQLWLNPRTARGLQRLVADDFASARTDLESVAAAAPRLGLLNTAAFSFAYLARTEWMIGAWDDAALHAERAVAIILESDFRFMQLAVIGIAVLVPAGRGDWATAEGYLQTMAEKEGGYERSVLALGMSRARVGEARADPNEVLAALEPVHRFPQRDAADEPGFWPWQDLYADALVAMKRVEEADAFLIPHEELALKRSRRSTIARLARARGGIEAALGRAEQAEAAFTLALRATDGLHVPFERARIELAAGRFLRRSGQRRRAAVLLVAAQERFQALGADPYATRCAQELLASGLAPAGRIGRDRSGLTSQELVVGRLAALGRSNREIADELVVSIKTVEYHLRNAFAKLGVTSRRQLPAVLSKIGAEQD